MTWQWSQDKEKKEIEKAFLVIKQGSLKLWKQLFKKEETPVETNTRLNYVQELGPGRTEDVNILILGSWVVMELLTCGECEKGAVQGKKG